MSEQKQIKAPKGVDSVEVEGVRYEADKGVITAPAEHADAVEAALKAHSVAPKPAAAEEAPSDGKS